MKQSSKNPPPMLRMGNSNLSRCPKLSHLPKKVIPLQSAPGAEVQHRGISLLLHSRSATQLGRTQGQNAPPHAKDFGLSSIAPTKLRRIKSSQRWLLRNQPFKTSLTPDSSDAHSGLDLIALGNFGMITLISARTMPERSRRLGSTQSGGNRPADELQGGQLHIGYAREVWSASPPYTSHCTSAPLQLALTMPA